MINFQRILKRRKRLLSICILVSVLIPGCATQMENKSSSETGQLKKSKVIHSLTTDQSENSFNILIEGSDNLAFTSVKQPFPTGVILYFPNTMLKNIQSDVKFSNGIVESIKSTEYKQKSHTARIEILLRKDVGYKVSKEKKGLLISFIQNEVLNANMDSTGSIDHNTSNKISPLPTTLASSGTSKLEEIQNTYDQPNVKSEKLPIPVKYGESDVKSKELPIPAKYGESDVERKELPIPVKMIAASDVKTDDVNNPAETSASIVETQQTAWMNRIDFSTETSGKSVLIIGTTVPIHYKIKKTEPTKIKMQLINTNTPKYRQRPLITTRFESAVDRIMPFQTPTTGSSSIVSIELREDVPYFVEQTSTLLTVHFEASSIPPRPLDKANLPDWQQVIRQTTIEPSIAASDSVDSQIHEEIQPEEPQIDQSDNITELTISESELPVTNTHAYAAGEFGSGKKKYIGEKIALDFYKTDIKNVFRILREVSGKNFAIDKDVNGSVTLTLDKPVPWDQVMDLVLKMNQLGMIYEQDIIRIATLETLRNEEDQRSAQLEAAKKAQQQKELLEPTFTEYIPVNYSQAATEVLPHIKNILTKERGSVSVDDRNNQIIITDTRDVIKQAREIVKRIDKVTPQVVIEARIVEVSNNFTRELGIQWGADYGPTYSDVLDMDFTGNMAMNFPAATATSGIGINFSRLDGLPFVLNARINALETQGDGKILSSPKIVTLDNKKARIKQGLEYPYLERDDSGGSSVKFKNIDLLLEVTPHVTPDNRISMSIFITKNDVAGVTDGVPSIATNEAETELLVNDGDTIVIGGIIKAAESGGQSGFPGLSRIPVLGWLFKNETGSEQKNELLIFMTPRIMQLEQL
jgi:type IV pilus assembly protein PilQ